MTLAIFGSGGHARYLRYCNEKKVYFFDKSKKKFQINNRIYKSYC